MEKGQSMLLLFITFCGLFSSAFSQCIGGWRPYETNCYYFSDNTKAWHDAQNDCEGKGSNLMSILDVHERTWVRTQVTTIHWIGLNDVASEGVWEWSDGSVFDSSLAYWREGQPDNWQDNEHCGQVDSNGRWNDEPCNAGRRYICKRLNPNPTPICLSGWAQYDSNCYKLKDQLRKSWIAARTDCVREGGDLVSITTEQEQQYVTVALDDTPLDIWIGYSTLKCTTISCQIQPNGTQFSWSDADPAQYTAWDGNQPDLSDKQSGLCTGMIKEAGTSYGKWKTHLCRYERPYMCKRALETICPPGWLSFSGNCYWVVSNTNLLTSWHLAQTKCSDIGTNLVTIKNDEEQFFINSLLPDLHQVDVPDIWIGLSDKDKDGTFQWVDRNPIEYSNWNQNFPQDTATMWDCGQIYTGNYNGKWETTNCFKNLGYICKMIGGQNVKPTSAPDSYCDEGYLLFGDYCYHFEAESVKTWQDAKTYCTAENGNLVSIHNQETVSFLTAHMLRSSWIGLNDIQTEGQYVWTDGTITDYVSWEPTQPDNWLENEDCIHIRGTEHYATGKFNDLPCTATYPFICQKAKGQEPPPVPPTTGPGWNAKCGSWVSDPFNDYCYLFSYLSMRNWADATADCVNQGGNLLSITDPFEQAFIQPQVQLTPTGVSLWMGGHDSVTEGGWEWTDGKPFRYINWAAGNPDNYYGEDCLSILINSGYWNDDNCDNKRGYICKRRGNTPEPPPPHDGYYTVYACQDSSSVLHCPENSVINIQSAFFGRKSDAICPLEDGATGTCEVQGTLPLVRKNCDNRAFCFLYAHTEDDPCPNVNKYLEVVYSCEQNVCVRGLGVEDGNITDSMLSASSSASGNDPAKGRLNGNSCWIPSAPANSWIQVNLGMVKRVTGVVIQGCPTADHWVTKFKIQTSVDGIVWNNDINDMEYVGSQDRDSPETQLLGTPASVKYIRVLPLQYNVQPGLRLDILGCTPDYAVSCSAKPNFNHAIDRMTVHCPAGCALQPYIVYGSTMYRGDSTICAAAIHAGVVLNDNGGDCTLLKAPDQSFYSGSTRNGITSRQYNDNYEISYQFADGELRCSGPDWYEFGEFCYKPFGDKKTWTAARDECRKLGADLVSIMSMTEQSWLESYLYAATSDVWIGLNAQGVFSGLYTWSNDDEVTFTYWAPGEPNNHLGFDEDCVEMYDETGRWNDVTCTELNTYICKMAKDHYPLPSVKPTVYGCPQGWDVFEYSCYWFEETARTRLEAKTFCEQREGTLLHIMDLYEQAHFTALMAGYTGLWWMGLRAQGETAGVDYFWDNGASLTYTNWDRNQPDNHAGPCVTMSTKPLAGFWNNKPCEESYPFVCETQRDGISPPTQRPTPQPVQGCEAGWSAEPHFRNCYRLFTVDYSQKKSWAAAREDCLSRGSDLVSIHNTEEEVFLSKYTKGRTKWIGLKHNPVEGGYHWSDGTPVSHTNWGQNEPNNHGDREDCVEMVSTANGTSWWNDLNCDAHQDWVCMITKGETPIIPPVPPSSVPALDCGTNPGWRKNDGICYYYNDTDIVDFYTAKVRCTAEKARLVSIANEAEQSFVVTMVGTGQSAAAWIGMQNVGVAGVEYQWVDFSPVTYVHWGPGEPNNAGGEEQCAQMNRYPGSWNDVNCGRASAGYVCKKLPGEDHTPAPPTPAWTGYCPQGWMQFRNKCYMFKGNGENEFNANWTFARDWCRSQKGDLAVIDDQYENDYVSSYLRDLVLPVWIGLSDRLHEGKFAWSDGVSPVLYTNWAEKEPNNHDDKEHCTAITHNHLVTGRWNDDKCEWQRGWVCYMKKSSSIPAPPPTSSPCPSGYISWYNNCYKLVEELKTWELAQVACEQDRGNLASVDQSYDQAFIAGAVQQGMSDAWIGLRRKEDGNSYTWTDGWPVFFTHWGPGEPTVHKGEGCVSMNAPSYDNPGTWNDTACDSAKPYICKISSEKPPPTPAPGDGKCLPGWWPYGRYCYFVYNGKLGFSWPEAQHYCQLVNGGELASIHSRAEVEFIRNMNYTKYHHVWIGLTKDVSLGWGWTDLSAVNFINWAPGEPNEADHDMGMENCVEMYPDGRWNDNNCVQKRGFACQHRQFYLTDENGPIIPTDPSSPLSNGGVIAGAIIGAIVVLTLILGLLYYVFSVRGVKLSGISFPSRESKNIDVPAFHNPNFSGESET